MNPNPTLSKPVQPRFIAEFEGVRGALAAWVVFGHILLFSGFTYADGWFGVIFSPVLGVYAFMMLSGFVITAALDQRPTTWLKFMTRRFFRLFPTYLLCVALAIVLFNVSVSVSQSNALARFGPDNLERLRDVEAHRGIYLLADATLLQCLMPRAWFPFAHESFLPPTWSLTIEWLFYMIAPLLLFGLRRNRLFGIGIFVSGLAGIYLFENQLTVINRSFHLGNAFHFMTGIASYFVWKHLPERTNCLFSKVAFWLAMLCGIAVLSLPYKIWFATMTLVMYDRVHANRVRALEWPRTILLSRPMQFLGRTSYVTYLLHWVAIELALFGLLHIAPNMNNRFLLAVYCTLTVYPITYVASDLIHRYLELPVIRWAKRGNRASTSKLNSPLVAASPSFPPSA